MPETRFRIRWPDQTETDCYSPSLIVKEYFVPGESYDLDDFVSRSREALNIASERVFQKFGFECTSAMAQIAEIESIVAQQRVRPTSQPEDFVTVLSFHDK